MASKWTSIYRFLFRRPAVERELDAELQYHVDRQAELNLRRGMTPDEARRQARLALGGIQPLKDDCREARVGRAIETLVQDVRYGLRVLRKNPGYACATIVTLALGIGANTAIFSLVYGVFLRPLPYRDGGRLVVLHQRVAQAHLDNVGFSPLEVADYADHNHTLDGVVEHHSMSFTLFGKDTAERVDTSVVSVNFFDVLGVRPLLGRGFLPSDNNPSSGAVMILSHQYWQSHQGGDPNVVGKVFQLASQPTTVIGVLPPIPQFPVESEVYMPTWQCPSRSNPRNIANRKFRLISAVFGRLKPGISPEQAQADLSVVASQIATAHPDVYPPNSGYSLGLDTLKYDLTHEAHTAFLVLLGVAAFVLLVACANVANMMLARLLKLERELAVRAALGAGKLRLMRQLVTESVLLSVTGGALGLALAPLTLKMLSGFAARFTPRAAEVHLDTPVLLFTLFVSLATGILFGLVPALSPWKSGGDSLLHGARTTSGRGRQSLRGALVIAQVAVSFVLLIGAGLMIRSFLKLGRENPGFDPVHLLSARVGIPSSRYPQIGDRRRVRDNITRKVEGLGAVESVSWVTSVPLSPSGIQSGPGIQEIEIEGRPLAKGSLAPTVDITYVGPGYFQTMRQPLLQGRYLTAEDENEKSPFTIVINQTMARHRWPGEDPVGRRIRFNAGDVWNTIIGIVGDTREYGLNQQTLDEAYLPDRRLFASSIVVRTGIDPAAVLPLVRATIHNVDVFLPVDQAETLPRFESESLAPSRLMTILLGIFACLAVLISASGIAAVMALSVSQRTHELGVRLALGAPRSSILRMVVRTGLSMAMTGIALGGVAAAVLARLLSTLLYQTEPTDAPTFIAVSLVFLAVASFACYVPARQVTTIDPLNALRQE